jgi:hypothetical protein
MILNDERGAFTIPAKDASSGLHIMRSGSRGVLMVEYSEVYREDSIAYKNIWQTMGADCRLIVNKAGDKIDREQFFTEEGRENYPKILNNYLNNVGDQISVYLCGLDDSIYTYARMESGRIACHTEIKESFIVPISKNGCYMTIVEYILGKPHGYYKMKAVEKEIEALKQPVKAAN